MQKPTTEREVDHTVERDRAEEPNLLVEPDPEV